MIRIKDLTGCEEIDMTAVYGGSPEAAVCGDDIIEIVLTQAAAEGPYALIAAASQFSIK